MRKSLKIYLSGKIILKDYHIELREHIITALNQFCVDIYLPHELAPVPQNEAEKEKYYPEITQECLLHIDKADLVIANIGDYGKDTAAEIVYSYMKGKTIIGLAENQEYKNDFFVRSFVHRVVNSEKQLLEVILSHMLNGYNTNETAHRPHRIRPNSF